jgi:hypothetical protein
MDLELIEKYKRLFGIKVAIREFSAKELKRRWRILSKKYHPDHGGKHEHFIFIQDAFNYLKDKCKGLKDSNENVFESVLEGYEVNLPNGESMYIWDTGYPPNPAKRQAYEKKYPHRFRGKNLNVRI